MTAPQYLIDANLCIAILQGQSESAARRLAQCERGQVVTSAVAYAEVMDGAKERGSMDDALAFFAQIPVLPFNEAAGQVYSHLPFKRNNFGRLIAAQALSLGLTVVTSDLRDFSDVPDLSVENWAEP